MSKYGVFSGSYLAILGLNTGIYGPENIRIWTLFRQWSLASLSTNIIDDKTFPLLYNVNCSNSLDFPYENYGKFDLDNLCDDESKCKFGFNPLMHNVSKWSDTL